MMQSAIYQGELRHRRFYPKSHEFSYSSTLFFIDLDELPELFEGALGWSLEKRNLGYFRRADFLGDPSIPLKSSVKSECQRLLGYCPDGAVRMLTNLRILGMCFNPVTFYFLFNGNSAKPAVVLAQVNNTPWDERHVYALECDPVTGKTNKHFDKEFHVSPFNPMAMEYRWVSTTPDEHLVIHMENHAAVQEGSEVVRHMDATLTLVRLDWDKKLLQRVLWQQPWMSLKVPVAIYWQALKLFIKGVPFHAHQSGDKLPLLDGHHLSKETERVKLKTTGESL